MPDDYEMEMATSREEAATVLHGLADGLAAGGVQLGEDGPGVEVPRELELEVECEVDDGEVSLQVELEWPEDATEADDEPDEASDQAAFEADDGAGEDQEAPTPVAVPAGGEASQLVSLGRFELFEDQAGEWRWRLVHRNGNIVATSGEGYTRKHNARKGLRSVMRDAPGAEVTERE
jgi:amphi-Trp domain-containing protein